MPPAAAHSPRDVTLRWPTLAIEGAARERVMVGQIAFVVVTWLGGLALVLGLGLPVGLLVGGTGPRRLRSALWSGLALLILLAGVLHLWLPMRSPVARGLVVACALGGALAVTPRTMRTGLAGGWRRPDRLVAVLAGVALLCLAIGSTRAPTNYDSGLYHLAAVAFAAQHPAIAGLANLHAPLGYATPHFPLAALLTNGPLGDTGYRALVGLVAALLVLDLLLRLSEHRRSIGAWVGIVTTTVVTTILLWFADWLVASPTSDSVVFVLCAASLAGYSDLLVRRRVAGVDVITTFVPLLVATALRPQSVIVVIVMTIISIYAIRRHGRRTGTAQAVVFSLVMAAALAAAMAARDRILSGWLGYPLTSWGFDVPWQAADASRLRNATIAIARDPGPDYGQATSGYDWLPSWLGRQLLEWETWLLAVLLISAMVLLWLGARRRPLRARALLALIAPGAVMTSIWLLLLPPTWRLMWGPILGTAAALCGWGLHAVRADPDRLARVGVALTAIIGLACVALRYPTKPTETTRVGTVDATLRSGLVVQKPIGSDQCWTAGPRCTPAPARGLRPLGPDEWSGFARRPSA